MSAMPPKFLQLTQNFCRRRYTSIRIFKMTKCCDTAWQQDDEKLFPFRNLSGVTKFKAIKRICMFDKVIVFAIQHIATNIWKYVWNLYWWYCYFLRKPEMSTLLRKCPVSHLNKINAHQHWTECKKSNFYLTLCVCVYNRNSCLNTGNSR